MFLLLKLGTSPTDTKVPDVLIGPLHVFWRNGLVINQNTELPKEGFDVAYGGNYFGEVNFLENREGIEFSFRENIPTVSLDECLQQLAIDQEEWKKNDTRNGYSISH